MYFTTFDSAMHLDTVAEIIQITFGLRTESMMQWNLFLRPPSELKLQSQILKEGCCKGWSFMKIQRERFQKKRGTGKGAEFHGNKKGEASEKEGHWQRAELCGNTMGEASAKEGHW